MKLPDFPADTRLPSLQAYVSATCVARGWDQSPDTDIFMLFVEEVGELAKAMRKRMALYQEAGKDEAPEALAHEFADVLSYLLDLANRCNVDLESAFREKEKLNKKRSWT